ncbi:MAG: nucleoside triphosphate pyrophosphohydrolase family protein [Patescibacteria group bacterium]
MNFDEYQKLTGKTAVYPKILGKNFVYPALGLAGETGEVLEKIKKIFRDKKGKVLKEDRVELEKELGDALWYLSQLSTELGIKLSDVAKMNIEKLKSRKQRDKIHGSGDNR